MSFSRRDFFKKSLATGAGVAAASVLAPIPTEAQSKPAKKPIPVSVSEDVVPSTGDKVLLNKIRQARYVASKPKVSSLGILHYTDIHGDSIAANKILSIMDDYAPYIDAVLNTGDAVQYFVEPTKEYPFGAQWWRDSGLAEKSLFVLGNHDGAKGTNSKGHKEGSADWDFYGKEKSYDIFFKDYVEGLGCVMPEGNDDPKSKFYKSCFWHKDFPEAKIRLIGADCMHFYDTFRHKTSEQEEWLTARLEDTLDPSNPAYGYSVIVASHYPLDDFEGEDEMWDEASHKFKYNSSPEGGIVIDSKSSAPTPFHTISMKSFNAEKRFAIRQKIANSEAKYGYDKSEVNPLGDASRAWKDKGGKFIAWICGHCHFDMLYYPAKYPDMLCVALDQAGNLRGNAFTDRGADLESRVCANYYGIDTQNGLFKIVRIGLTMDKFMVQKNTLCYDYINNVVISG